MYLSISICVIRIRRQKLIISVLQKVLVEWISFRANMYNKIVSLQNRENFEYIYLVFYFSFIITFLIISNIHLFSLLNIYTAKHVPLVSLYED